MRVVLALLALCCGAARGYHSVVLGKDSQQSALSSSPGLLPKSFI